MITMNDLSSLANALVEADEAVEKAEGVLKGKKEEARRLREEALPSAMQEVGLTKVTLDSGRVISVAQEVYASISADNKPAAYAWLEEHDFGGLIKTEVSVAFGRGEMEKAKGLQDELRGKGMQVDIDSSIHAQTLKAFIKEQLAAGNGLPLDLFGAMPVWVAKVK